ncbi:TPA: GDP-mannose 4,6-dehydratase, partial [archaeon]|nr:GDP-mannose 4,6-dehydratase [Candidatus Naiadarchaeales archaeon SRR2090153.bin1042]
NNASKGENKTQPPVSGCTENWACEEWSGCINGAQTRDFTFVTDCVEAFILAAKSNIQNEVFNVSVGEGHSVNEIIELLGGGEVVHLPKRPGEPDKTLSDSSKIKRMLGWAPKVKFEDGVKIMLANINYWKNAPVWNENSISKATAEWFQYLGKKKLSQ